MTEFSLHGKHFGLEHIKRLGQGLEESHENTTRAVVH